ncbi:serine/threonine-protein kinase/endoribonuclease IRE1a-like isoform X2 [Sesamum indicum]|uniref:non-specific serine/threonine protein kinase n=1 Tax=Sesamum indicum TaxID=4182 RepID=A0A6I9UB99_SESIN|nr:serine/threonine-protein kinase/endoribonuclease IRE1a-like isoform X2 [Sesamum indicum]XP_011096966.1 serine/threonine-protein kinase/endoribonuclease IRE1a-like isoform X2 [Sesamum indicum]
MKHCTLLLFLCILFLFGAFSGSAGDFLNLNNGVKRYGDSFQVAARRSLLSATSKGDTALVAALDGTIYLLEVGSMRPLWSFSSGPQIYSSYQAPVSDKENASGVESNYFIDCGDDWELYAHNSLGKLKLMKSLEEYISSTPQIAEDGGIVLGSKKTTAFLVDAKTGRVIHTYRMSDPPSTTQSSVNDVPYNITVKEQYQSGSSPKTDELPLYITRTDYRLTSFMPNSNEVLWNVTVAEIGAAFLCQDSLGFMLSDLESSEPLPHNMPLPCQSRALVYRFRNHNMLETLSMLHRPPEVLHPDMMLPASTADVLPSQPNVEKVLELLPLSRSSDFGGAHDSKDLKAVLPLHTFGENCGVTNVHEVKVLSDDGSITPQWEFGTSKLILLFICLVVFVVYHYSVVSTIKVNLAMKSTGMSSPNTQSKRKKSRKTGKVGSYNVEQDKQEDEAQHIHNGGDNNFLLNLNQPTLVTDGRRIGIYEGRPVAVKRLVRAHNDIAFKEIQNLIVSDCHPNIVRWYGVEQDQDFVYLALERCACSLNDLILMHLKSSSNPTLGKNLDAEIPAEFTISLDSMKGSMQEFELWNSDGYPSHLLLKLMRDVISGIAHLHELGIVHRDLKPQNVLIIRERSLCAKLSDMGISKRLVGDMSSLSNHATGSGSSGWQAPEQLLHGRQTRGVDLFSLGCVLFFCITGGRHPFGNRLERDINIVKSKVDLFLVEHIPEAVDLILRLLDPNAEMRPRALEVLYHPLFWNAEMRLSFLRDTSDRVELEDREANSDLLKSLESTAPVALGAKWNEKMEPLFLNNIGRYRRYRFDSVRDLLRVMRNKLNHYRELPAEIQEMIGPVPEGFDRYFRSRFPKLLIEVYKVMLKYCSTEECFSKYFTGSAQ